MNAIDSWALIRRLVGAVTGQYSRPGCNEISVRQENYQASDGQEDVLMWRLVYPVSISNWHL